MEISRALNGKWVKSKDPSQKKIVCVNTGQSNHEIYLLVDSKGSITVKIAFWCSALISYMSTNLTENTRGYENNHPWLTRSLLIFWQITFISKIHKTEIKHQENAEVSSYNVHLKN